MVDVAPGSIIRRKGGPDLWRHRELNQKQCGAGRSGYFLNADRSRMPTISIQKCSSARGKPSRAETETRFALFNQPGGSLRSHRMSCQAGALRRRRTAEVPHYNNRRPSLGHRANPHQGRIKYGYGRQR